MSVVEGGPSATNIIQRVQNILLKPAAEWDVIDAEPASVQGLFMGYAAILAAIPPIALVLQHLLFIHWGIVPIIVLAILTYVANLVGVFILGFIFDALAPSFDGQKNLVQAMKAAVYPYTAMWLAGILNIVPVLGILALIAGLYGLYILWLGLPKLMKIPQEKAVGYFVVSIVVAIVVNAIIGAVIAAVTTAMLIGAAASGAAAFHSDNSSHNPGGLAGVVAAANQIESASKAAENGHGVAAVDPQKLKGLLPDSVAGMPRTEMTASSGGAAGINASNVEAVYSNDTNRITVTVTDLAAMQGFAGMAAAMNVNSDKETATGYEKVSTVNGRLTTEEWDRQSKNGKYGVVVANRFSVEATGNAGSIDDLKAAVAAVGPDRLEGLAHS